MNIFCTADAEVSFHSSVEHAITLYKTEGEEYAIPFVSIKRGGEEEKRLNRGDLSCSYSEI